MCAVQGNITIAAIVMEMENVLILKTIAMKQENVLLKLTAMIWQCLF
jgi:hypothetical protein